MGYHRPVLLNESIEGLDIKPGGSYVDLTFGGGGHSREVLKKLGKKGRLLVFDQDQDALANVPDDKRLLFAGTSYRYLKHFLKYHGMDQVDGILADLGISSHQIDRPERGFSFKSEAPLDMRMDVRTGRHAADVLNEEPANELARIFRTYGELKNAMSLARAVVSAREEDLIRTTGDLEKVLERFIPARHPSKFLARVYQALRIEVNREMDDLAEMLLQTTDVLKPGGRLVVITYHSIEDRIVKNFMRAGKLDGQVEKDFYGRQLSPWKLVNRNIITPGEAELEVNNRARSAKLRIAERIREADQK